MLFESMIEFSLLNNYHSKIENCQHSRSQLCDLKTQRLHEESWLVQQLMENSVRVKEGIMQSLFDGSKSLKKSEFIMRIQSPINSWILDLEGISSKINRARI